MDLKAVWGYMALPTQQALRLSVIKVTHNDAHESRQGYVSSQALYKETVKPMLYILNLFIYFILWLCRVFVFYARASSSCGERGPLFIAVRGPLTVAASLVAEHKLQMRRLTSCGSRA